MVIMVDYNNGRLQYLRFCLFEMYVSHRMFVQRSEFNSD